MRKIKTRFPRRFVRGEFEHCKGTARNIQHKVNPPGTGGASRQFQRRMAGKSKKFSMSVC